MVGIKRATEHEFRKSNNRSIRKSKSRKKKFGSYTGAPFASRALTPAGATTEMSYGFLESN